MEERDECQCVECQCDVCTEAKILTKEIRKPIERRCHISEEDRVNQREKRERKMKMYIENHKTGLIIGSRVTEVVCSKLGHMKSTSKQGLTQKIVEKFAKTSVLDEALSEQFQECETTPFACTGFAQVGLMLLDVLSETLLEHSKEQLRIEKEAEEHKRKQEESMYYRSQEEFDPQFARGREDYNGPPATSRAAMNGFGSFAKIASRLQE